MRLPPGSDWEERLRRHHLLLPACVVLAVLTTLTLLAAYHFAVGTPSCGAGTQQCELDVNYGA